MLDFKSSKKGFTLIELLVVIFIIGILSALAVNGYTQYRREALLDLGAQNFIAQIDEMRNKTSYGDFGSERYEEIVEALKDNVELGDSAVTDPKCYGLHFENGEAYSFSQKFENKKVWKGELNGWGFDGCGEFLNFGGEKIDLGEMKIDEIMIYTAGLGSVSKDFALRFYPPKGDVEFSGNEKPEKMEIYLRYGETTEDRYKRIIEIDLNSLKAKVNVPENA